MNSFTAAFGLLELLGLTTIEPPALWREAPYEYDVWQKNHVDRAGEARFADAMMELVPTFRELVDCHYEGLYRFAVSLSRRPSTAEDLVQQTFLQWARKGHTLRDGTKAKTWLFTTLYREWLGIARREKRIEMVEFNPDVHDGGGDGNEDAIEPEDVLMVNVALDRLDDSFRVPLVLFYMKDMSYKKISEVLDVPIGTVMSRLSRGKDMLRKALRQVMASGVPAALTSEPKEVV